MNKELYPLTSPQINMWKLDQVNTESKNLTTIFSVLKLPQSTNLKLLDKTLNKIREINDSLRLRFVITSDSPNATEIKQYIEPYKYIPSRIIYHDFEEILTVIENEKNNHLSIPDNINELAIIKTPYNCFVLYKSHHIAADGWGMTQVANQIKEIYCALENEENLDEYQKPSYLNFVKRDQEYLNSSKYEKDAEYWAKIVKEIEPSLFLKNINNFDKAGKRFEKYIDQNTCKKIENFCAKYKLTEYSFFLAVISIYFYYTYSTNNFAIGTPFLNRQKRFGEFDETGLHIATLPLHINIDTNEDFVELCQRINSKNLSLYKHGSFPYHEIQKLFENEKKVNSNLYEIAFSYQINISDTEFTSKCYDKTIKNHWNTGIGECTWFFSGEQNNAITFHLTQLNVKKIFSIDYLTSIFTDTEIENIYDSIFHLINQILNFNENSIETSTNTTIETLTNKSTDTLIKISTENSTNTSIETSAENPTTTTNETSTKNLTNTSAKTLIKTSTETSTNTSTNIKVSDLQLINSSQIEELRKFNKTGNMPQIDKNVIDYLEEVVKKHPNKTALIYNNLKMSYTDFYEKINTLADELIDNGIYPNSPIVLLFDKSFDMIISMFATLKIGCYYVPILPDENQDRINYILNDCKPSIILTHKNYNKLIEKTGINYLNLNNIFSEVDLILNSDEPILDGINFETQTDNTEPFIDTFNDFLPTNNLNISIKDKTINPSSIAYTIYTSGSTGNPKGVQVMHKNIISLIESMKHDNILKPTFSDISMSLLKYSFDASGIDIYSSLLVRWYTCTSKQS